MTTFEETASKSGIVGGRDESTFNTALPPPADIFVIPTHATTHASTSAFADQTDDGSNVDGEAQTLQGRPKPTTGLELIENIQQRDDFRPTNLPPGAAAPIHPPPTDPSFDMPLSYPATGPWRTAQTILSKDLSNIHLMGDPSTQRDVRPNPAITITPTQEISPPLTNTNDAPPPKYRRNHWTPFSPAPPGGRNAERGIINQDDPETSAQGGRFPRWRGWLEKRAMERHYAQADATVLPGSSPTLERESDVQRKRSWGAGVEDDDALSEIEETEQGTPFPIDAPLHIHNFGSRFIPHIPSLPICAVSIELPPAAVWSTARLLRRSVPEASKRRVLLVGTIDGLYAVEFRRQRREEEGVGDSFSRKFRGADPRSRQFEKGTWNGDIRVVQVWSGVGVYQLSILTTQQQQQQESDSRSYLSNLTTRPSLPTQDTGILLALCSTKIDYSKNHSPFAVPAASQSGLLSDVNFSVGGGSSTPGHGHHRESSPKVLSTGYVGHGGGGGQAKICPPSGSGDVRMWSIEAIRRIVTYVLDSANHQPLDLLRKSKVSKSGIGKSNFAARIRKVWAHLGDPSSDRKINRISRQYSSDQSPVSSNVGTQMRLSNSADGGKMMSASRIAHNRSQSEQLLSNNRMFSSPTERDSPTLPEDSTIFDSNHQECLRLAQSWVPIVLPGSHPYSAGGAAATTHSESNSSLYSDDNVVLGPSNSNLGHSTPSSAPVPNVGKGISFYALIEAGPEVHGTGTWYLALAQAKTILLYESVKPIGKNDARSWAFMKEFYTPVPPKSMTFCFSESPDTDEMTRTSLSSTATTSSNRRQLAAQKSVKSSSYSSVFRSHPILNLFVSLGRKAVLIRASDGNVKEVELKSKGKTFENELTMPISDTGHHSTSKSSLGHSHSRRGSDMHELQQNTKEHWVGIDRVTAQVTIRCKHHNLNQDMILSNEVGNNSRFDEDEDEEDEDAWDSDGPVTPGEKGVTLHDTSTGMAGKASLLRRQQQKVQIPSYNIFASLAILSKSTFTHILPSPLPRDVFQPRPLEVVQWSAVPTAVTASARVIGLERDLSSGAVSVDTLGRGKQRRTSMMSSYSSNTGGGNQTTNSSNTVILHILVSILACLPSRMEMKRVRIRLPIRTPFVFRRDSELELETSPIPPPPQHILASPSLAVGAENGGGRGGGDDGNDQKDQIEANQELEYLCGMLLPTLFDQPTLKPWAAAGDGGAWAFDWRGANDFRLFYAGVQI